jgi:hypothetical protein
MGRSIEEIDMLMHVSMAVGEERYKDIVNRIDRLEGLMLKGGGIIILGMCSILTKLILGV